MTARRTGLLVALLTACACFRDGTLPSPLSDALPGSLLVRDREGASYPPSAAPRDVVLVLSYMGAAHAAPHVGSSTTLASAVLLLRGQLDAALSARLESARKSAAVAGYSQAVRVERAGDELRVEPLVPLSPGADYTLFWLGGEAAALAYPIRVSPAPALGARLIETWPSERALAPPNLQRVLLRFDGDVADALAAHVALYAHHEADALSLGEAALPARLEPVRCARLGLPEGDCAWLTPTLPLQAGGAYTLALDATLRTQTGAQIAAQQTEFTVGTRADHEPPSFVASACARDEQTTDNVCTRAAPGALTVRGTLDESALLSLTSVDEAGLHVVSALSFANAFELSLDVSSAELPLRAGASAPASSVTLRARDLAGNERELPLSFVPAADLAAVVIDEVLANPRGKEPAQEWVELLNSALTPSSLMGFTLSTDPGERGRLIPGAVVLAPDERALLVSPDFDPRDLADGALPAGLRLVALDGSLSLANASATLYLRDALGRRVSTARVLAPLFEGQCSARLPSPTPGVAGGPGHDFALDPAGACTPGGATFRAPEEPRALVRSRAERLRASTLSAPP